MREEHAPYFEALEQHPRLLVGQNVPAIGREGTELLRDTNDAREWQEAVKGILVDEVRGRAAKTMEENAGFLSTVHQSIELFQNNTDLIPGTAEFDVELANRFADFASPYELRVEGKLQGYSIPVQPLVDRIRDQLVKERASASEKAGTPVTPATPVAGAPAASTTAPPSQTQSTPPEPPQAGIQSKAGNSESSEDFSTLFGTIGLPNLQI